MRLYIRTKINFIGARMIYIQFYKVFSFSFFLTIPITTSLNDVSEWFKTATIGLYISFGILG